MSQTLYNATDNEILATRLEREARAKFVMLRGVTLQCGHTEADMANGNITLADSWLLVRALDGGKQIMTKETERINCHPLVEKARESLVKDETEEMQKAASAFTGAFQ